MSTTSSAMSTRALLLLSHLERYMAVSFSSFLIFLVIWGKKEKEKQEIHIWRRSWFFVSGLLTPWRSRLTFSISCLNVVKTSLLFDKVL